MISEKQRKHILKLAKINKERYKKYGHNLLGFKHSKNTKLKIRKFKLGEKNPMWKGDRVGYFSLHEWVNKYKPKSKFCENCKEKPPHDLTNKGIYNRDFKNWEWLCRKCHMKKDGRLKKLNKINHNRKISEEKKKKHKKEYYEKNKEWIKRRMRKYNKKYYQRKKNVSNLPKV